MAAKLGSREADAADEAREEWLREHPEEARAEADARQAWIDEHCRRDEIPVTKPQPGPAQCDPTITGAKVRYFLATAMLLGCFSTQAKSEDLSGLELFDQCTSNTEQLRTTCDVWINGFAAGFSSAREAGFLEPRICFPDGFTGAQAAIIIKKFMNEYPHLLRYNAKLVATVALANEFPCPEPEAD